jgi:hypothetical protein
LQEFKQASASVHSLDNYMRQVEVAAIAHFLANAYNQKRRPAVKIRFLACHVVEYQLSGGAGARRYNAESPLPAGEFVKFCNNMGYWDLDRADRWLADFSKWDPHTHKSTLPTPTHTSQPFLPSFHHSHAILSCHAHVVACRGCISSS